MNKSDIKPYANLIDANLIDANLTGADLTGADLTGANLIDANLIDANLIDANLRGANLTGAYLIDANLRGADLTGANLIDAKGIIRLSSSTDNYEFFGIQRSILMIKAGCRWFTVREARNHWTKTRGDTDLGRERLAFVDALVTIAKAKGWTVGE